jgi:hypothetical protein
MKLLAIGIKEQDGISVRVHPAFISKNDPLSLVYGSFNAVSIYGAGKEGDPDDTGLKFAHADDVPVIQAENIAAVPILGPESCVIAYASDVGWEGEFGTVPAPTQLPGRFINHYWYWVGGAKIVYESPTRLASPALFNEGSSIGITLKVNDTFSVLGDVVVRISVIGISKRPIL